MKSRLSIIAILSMFFAAAESEASATKWSYKDCVDHARDNNITLRKSRLSEETAAYDLE